MSGKHLNWLVFDDMMAEDWFNIVMTEGIQKPGSMSQMILKQFIFHVKKILLL